MTKKTKNQDVGGAFKAPPTSWFARICTLLIIIVAGWLGTAFMQEGLAFYHVVEHAAEFKSVEGKITKATVRREAKNYLPDVHFEYNFDGKNYETSNRYDAKGYMDAQLARQDLKQYKTGHKRVIYVDPNTPSVAILSKDVNPGPAYLRMVYGSGCYILVLISVISFFRARKRKRALAYSKHILAQKRKDHEQE